MTKKLKVLVVDDNPLVSKVIDLNLTHAGFEVFTADSGPAALDSLTGQQPDIILLDIGLPGMNGWQACRAIHDQYRIPVIMLSGHPLNNESAASLSAQGAADYILKPVSNRDLITRIEAVLNRREA